MYKFQSPQKILYGEGSLEKLGEVCKEYGNNVLIVSDEIMEKIGTLEKVTNILEKEGLNTFNYLGANTEPTDVFVKTALDVFNKNSGEVIVALGGGSCIDTAKAVSVVATNDYYIGEFMKNRVAKNPSIPLIALPTTSGTGSEATDVTVITDTTHQSKLMIKQTAFLPKVAIVDPELTMTSPKNVTSATGLDALCHAMESYFSIKAQPLTKIFSLAAIKKINKYLRTAYQEGSDIEARNNMAQASLEAGLAFSNASVTLIHGMSRPIGAMFHVPHGISNAMLLPVVLEFTKPNAIKPLSEIQRSLFPESKGSDETLADEFIILVQKLCQDLNIPNLKTWGINPEEFEKNLDKMAIDAIDSGSPANNPRVPSKEEIIELYKKCFDYQY